MKALAFLPLLLFAICVTPLAGRAAEPVATPQDRAEAALVAGDAATAVALAREMRRDDPQSYAAAFLEALGLFDLAEHRAAARAAQAAYHLAQHPADKRQAAQLAGNALFAAGAYTRASLWLRRAANHATDDSTLRPIAETYQAVRAANPLSLNLGAWIAPTDNINSGAENETFQLEGLPFDFILPPDRLALSGMEYAVEAQARYRISQGAQHQTHLGAYVFARSYALSAQSKADAPDASGSDFSFVVGDLSVSHQRQFAGLSGPSAFGLNAGRVWSGGVPTWDYVTASAQQGVRLGESNQLLLRLARTRQMPRTDSNAQVDLTEFSTTLQTSLNGGDSLSTSLTMLHSDGGFENIFDEYRGQIGFARGAPVWGMQLSGDLMLGFRNYDTFPTTLDGRRDRFGSIGLQAWFPDISYWGFSPELSLTATRTLSSAEEFTSRSVAAQISIRSNF